MASLVLLSCDTCITSTGSLNIIFSFLYPIYHLTDKSNTMRIHWLSQIERPSFIWQIDRIDQSNIFCRCDTFSHLFVITPKDFRIFSKCYIFTHSLYKNMFK